MDINDTVLPNIDKHLERYMLPRANYGSPYKTINANNVTYYKFIIEHVSRGMSLRVQIFNRGVWADLRIRGICLDFFVPNMLGNTTIRKINDIKKSLSKWINTWITQNDLNIKPFVGNHKIEKIKKVIKPEVPLDPEIYAVYSNKLPEDQQPSNV